MPATRKKYPVNPDISFAKKSSVLALFYPDSDKVMLVFIQRPLYEGVHSGQIAFPGGQFESSDINTMQTALRETYEEIGIPPENITIIGALSQLYIPPSNFLVNPFVGYLDKKPVFFPDPNEVHEVFALNIHELMKDDCFQNRIVSDKNYTVEVPCYYLNKHLIWGATSMILSELIEVINHQTKTANS